MDAQSLLTTQPEKPSHYTYLKEFRTQQCPLFLQHKCTQHRPYTCFHWHFANQRRRRPVRRSGIFSYTPDKYCGKYDETTGVCQDGDECLLLHRNCGDTERRYHLRYYKTATCVHETDSKGSCTKNGIHCAFAHGNDDLRNPTYDLDDIKAMENGTSPSQMSPVNNNCELTTSAEKEKILNEDPKWNDSAYVLANYKTEPCKRPPRLCRQGYACPQYHNNKDRRRSPQQFKYRSTPCPQVKHNDEWGDPASCSNGDNCQYCHTRTEQQFFPEIYKSTKCKDMVQNGYCPRGPFCAFAHVEQEMNKDGATLHQLESPRTSNPSLGSYLPTSLTENKTRCNIDNNSKESMKSPIKIQTQPSLSSSLPTQPITVSTGSNVARSLIHDSNNSLNNQITSQLSNSLSDNFSLPRQTSFPQPIGKERSMSLSETHKPSSFPHRFATQVSEPANYWTVTGNDDNVYGSSFGSNGMLSNYPPSSSLNNQSSVIGEVPNDDTVESVIGGAMDDLHLGDFHLSFVDENSALSDLQDRGDTASVCSSISAGLASSYLSNSGYLGSSLSMPVAIPDKDSFKFPPAGSLGSLSQSPPMSPFSSLSQTSGHNGAIDFPPDQAVTSRLALSSRLTPFGQSDLSNSHHSPRSASQTYAHTVSSYSPASGDKTSESLTIQKLKEEHLAYKEKLAKWEECIVQARGACDAWRKEAEEYNRKYQIAEGERVIAVRQRDEAVDKYNQLRRELEQVSPGITKNKPSINLTTGL